MCSLKVGQQQPTSTGPEKLQVRAAAWHDYQQFLFRAALLQNVRFGTLPTGDASRNEMAGKDSRAIVVLQFTGSSRVVLQVQDPKHVLRCSPAHACGPDSDHVGAHLCLPMQLYQLCAHSLPFSASQAKRLPSWHRLLPAVLCQHRSHRQATSSVA